MHDSTQQELQAFDIISIFNNTNEMEHNTTKPEIGDDTITPKCDSVEELTSDMYDQDHDAYDKYMSAGVLLPTGYNTILQIVIDRKHDANGQPIGPHTATLYWA